MIQFFVQNQKLAFRRLRVEALVYDGNGYTPGQASIMINPLFAQQAKFFTVTPTTATDFGGGSIIAANTNRDWEGFIPVGVPVNNMICNFWLAGFVPDPGIFGVWAEVIISMQLEILD